MDPWKYNSGHEMSDAVSRPNWGVVTGVHVQAADTVDGRQVSTNPNTTYDILITTDTGPVELKGRAPNQNRYDCWFYPAPKGSLAFVAWSGPDIYFTVHELPASEDC